jgi:hypothetical protein
MFNINYCETYISQSSLGPNCLFRIDRCLLYAVWIKYDFLHCRHWDFIYSLVYSGFCLFRFVVYSGFCLFRFAVYSGFCLFRFVVYSRFCLFRFVVYSGFCLDRVLFIQVCGLFRVLFIQVCGLFRVLFIQVCGLFRVWFIQVCGLFRVLFIKGCGLFRVLFRQISLYKINNLQHLINSLWLFLLPKTFKLFVFPIFWLWAYLMKVILETCSAQ